MSKKPLSYMGEGPKDLTGISLSQVPNGSWVVFQHPVDPGYERSILAAVSNTKELLVWLDDNLKD